MENDIMVIGMDIRLHNSQGRTEIDQKVYSPRTPNCNLYNVSAAIAFAHARLNGVFYRQML